VDIELLADSTGLCPPLSLVGSVLQESRGHQKSKKTLTGFGQYPTSKIPKCCHWFDAAIWTSVV